MLETAVLVADDEVGAGLLRLQRQGEGVPGHDLEVQVQVVPDEGEAVENVAGRHPDRVLVARLEDELRREPVTLGHQVGVLARWHVHLPVVAQVLLGELVHLLLERGRRRPVGVVGNVLVAEAGDPGDRERRHRRDRDGDQPHEQALVGREAPRPSRRRGSGRRVGWGKWGSHGYGVTLGRAPTYFSRITSVAQTRYRALTASATKAHAGRVSSMDSTRRLPSAGGSPLAGSSPGGPSARGSGWAPGTAVVSLTANPLPSRMSESVRPGPDGLLINDDQGCARVKRFYYPVVPPPSTTLPFRLVALLAAVSAWALVAVGGVVRITESGLG